MTESVLDASALIALLLGEQGGARVNHALAEAAMSTVNLAEVIGHFARKGSSEADIHEMLDPLPFTRVPLDDELAYHIGMLLPLTRAAGLSLGDRACLALARRLDVPALTADRAWQTVAAPAGVRVELIR